MEHDSTTAYTVGDQISPLLAERTVKYASEGEGGHVLSHRDIFNQLILASVSAQKDCWDTVTSSRLLNREGLSEFLWSAYRDLNGADTLSWCNFEVRKREGELQIAVKTGRPHDPRQVYVLATDGRRLFFVTDDWKKGKVGSEPTKHLCRRLTVS